MNDTIMIKLRPSAIYAFLQIVNWLLVTLILLYFAYHYFPWLIFGSLITLSAAAYQYLLIRSTRYEITTETLHITVGIFLKRTDTLELYRVKDYIIQQNLTEQLFRLMHLTLLTRDLTSPAITLRGIPKSNLPDTLRDLVQQSRKNNNNIIELN
jgi:uncharacterized membrane protein YdbT with pleckstrin-like domain